VRKGKEISSNDNGKNQCPKNRFDRFYKLSAPFSIKSLGLMFFIPSMFIFVGAVSRFPLYLFCFLPQPMSH
jgi:hypothetical protein